jgi:hypothetical protein
MTAHKKFKTESGRFGRFFVFGVVSATLSKRKIPVSAHEPVRQLGSGFGMLLANYAGDSRADNG